MPHLRSSSDPSNTTPLVFDDGEFVVGRHPACQMVIDQAAISRHHASFSSDGTNCFVKDLKSRNFTFLNGVKLDPDEPPSALSDEDRVRFCEEEFVFLEGDPPPSGGEILFVDDDAGASSSTIMSKVGVASSHGPAQLTATPEAKLNALLEITRSLGRALALDEVLPEVLNFLFKIFVQADRGFIALRTNDGTLAPRWSRTRREDAAETIRVSRTIVNKVMETQEGILSADVMLDDEFNKSQSIADFRIRSMMCAPLLDSDGNSMGVLQIDTAEQGKRFNQEDLEVLLAVASQAGIAIDNAEMHEKALRQRGMDRDLELAREVQLGFLPDSSPKVEGYEFFDYYRPANQVGGDYYDYLRLPDGRVGVIVADVVGKGVAAALLMAKLSAEARYCLASAADAGDAINMLNHRLCHLKVDRFVTAVILMLDPTTHQVSIANAGHMPPLLRNSAGKIAEPGHQVAGIPLGIDQERVYEHSSIELKIGESLTAYTDGLNEAESEDGHFFGIERIREKARHTEGCPGVLGQAIIDTVHEFIGDGAQSDDMCMVTFGRI